MSRKIKFVLVTAALIALVLVLTGCGNKDSDTPWEWAENLEDEDIGSVAFWCTAEYYNEFESDDDGKDTDIKDTQIKLSDKQLDKLCEILSSLIKDNFTENDDNAGITPLYGLTLTMADGTVYNINQAESDKGALEFDFADKQWLIDSAKLNDFINSFIAENNNTDSDKDSEDYSSEADLVPADLSGIVSDGNIVITEGIDYSTYSDLN